jgi:hypothetical protein
MLIVLTGVGLTLVGLPGNIVIFLTALGYGFYDGFVHFDQRFFIILLGALLLGEAVEFLAGAMGAKKAKASRRAIFSAFIGAVAGGIMGTAVFPLLGTLVGAVLVSFGFSYWAEYSKTGDAAQSSRVARSVAKGLVVGTLFKLAVAVGMATGIVLRLPWG